MLWNLQSTNYSNTCKKKTSFKCLASKDWSRPLHLSTRSKRLFVHARATIVVLGSSHWITVMTQTGCHRQVRVKLFTARCMKLAPPSDKPLRMGIESSLVRSSVARRLSSGALALKRRLRPTGGKGSRRLKFFFFVTSLCHKARFGSLPRPRPSRLQGAQHNAGGLRRCLDARLPIS